MRILPFACIAVEVAIPCPFLPREPLPVRDEKAAVAPAQQPTAKETAKLPDDFSSDYSPRPMPSKQELSNLVYYVYSEVPPDKKPAETVLDSLQDISLGTPVDEIKLASNAFGLDFTFMKAVARIESDFDPAQRTGSYIGLFQLSHYEFNKYGSGDIVSPRDNAIAAAYKFATAAILFELATHQKPTLY